MYYVKTIFGRMYMVLLLLLYENNVGFLKVINQYTYIMNYSKLVLSAAQYLQVTICLHILIKHCMIIDHHTKDLIT